MPIWLLILLMALTSYRGTRLLAKDDFPPVLLLRDRLAGGWRPMTEPEMARISAFPAQELCDINGRKCRYVRRAAWSPYWLAELVRCPWCVSAYVSAAVTAATASFVSVPDPWLIAPAVWALSALLASREWA